MSWLLCSGCGRLCDTDDEPDGWVDDRYYCWDCGTPTIATPPPWAEPGEDEERSYYDVW